MVLLIQMGKSPLLSVVIFHRSGPLSDISTERQPVKPFPGPLTSASHVYGNSGRTLAKD